MEKKKIEKLIPVFNAILAIIGIVFLCLSIFTEQKDKLENSIYSILLSYDELCSVPRFF